MNLANYIATYVHMYYYNYIQIMCVTVLMYIYKINYYFILRG